MCFLQVAAVSGDARRALELCRRAAEITEQRIHVSSICPASTDSSQNTATPSAELLQAPLDPLPAVNKLIGMADIEAAITEMFQAPHIQVLPIPNEYEYAVPIKEFHCSNHCAGCLEAKFLILTCYTSTQFMKKCAKYQKIFLVSMVTEQHRTTMVETTFEKVITFRILIVFDILSTKCHSTTSSIKGLKVACIYVQVVAAFMRLCNMHKEHLPGVDSLMAIG